MENYASGDLRNVCLVGAQGEGKTSLAEALFFNAGLTNRLGRIEEGNTVLDFMEDEIERKISINLSVAQIEHQKKKINLLVAPGYADFIGEAAAGLAVAETAVFVAGADNGINPLAENMWEYLSQINIPAAIYLNKLDRENLDFEKVLSQIKEKLTSQVVVMSAPDATGQKFSSVINLLAESVPEQFSGLKDKMIEDISSLDDALTEKYLEGKQITSQELKETLRKGIAERKIFPLLCGSAVKNIGVQELADFIAEFFPAPKASANENKFSALVYKTVSEPGMGHLNFVKVLSGSLATGKDVQNYTRQTKERIGQMCFIAGKKKVDAHSVSAGDIVALLKLKDTRTNDIIGEEKMQIEARHIEFPATVYDRSIFARSKGEEEKLGSALSIITLENPTIKHFFNPETKEMVVSGTGALQLEVMVKRIKSRYGVEVELHAPRVPYKETVKGKAEVQGKYKRQSGGRGQYGDCWLKIEPLERGKGFEFVNKIVGGAIPRNYIPAIEKGVREAMEQGVIAGYNVVDVRVTVYDGSYHEVDSSDMAFKIAGAMAFRKCVIEAKPLILEPIISLEVIVPDEYMGTVMGDLNSRRGRVLGMDKAGKREIVRAYVPLGQIFQYATDLRSITKGSGHFSMKLSHYEEAPFEIAQPLIDAFQKTDALQS